MPPLRVLRRDMLPVPASTWTVYGAALLALGLIMWRMSLDLVLTFALLGGGVIAALVLGSLLLLGLQSLRRILARATLAWRLGLGQLLRQPLAAAGQSLPNGLLLRFRRCAHARSADLPDANGQDLCGTGASA